MIGGLALTGCNAPAGTTVDAGNVAAVPEDANAAKQQTAFMEMSLDITNGCPPLDDSKTGKTFGPDDVPPTVPAGPGDGKPGNPSRVPLPSGDPDPADPPLDADRLEPVALTKAEACHADKFAAHATKTLKGVNATSGDVRAALKRAGYPEERIVDMSPEGGSPRARIDLRQHDGHLALQIVHLKDSTIVEKFGAQTDAPLKDVKYVPELAEPLG
jgi:hypothetical protein